MSFNQKEIGRRVNELRIGHHLSLDQLADAVNCTRDHLYRAERGEPRHGFSIDILIEIARYFDVSERRRAPYFTAHHADELKGRRT